jgi:hypothetical protein
MGIRGTALFGSVLAGRRIERTGSGEFQQRKLLVVALNFRTMQEFVILQPDRRIKPMGQLELLACVL